VSGHRGRPRAFTLDRRTSRRSQDASCDGAAVTPNPFFPQDEGSLACCGEVYYWANIFKHSVITNEQ
jgi:hypothetical protein